MKQVESDMKTLMNFEIRYGEEKHGKVRDGYFIIILVTKTYYKYISIYLKQKIRDRR